MVDYDYLFSSRDQKCSNGCRHERILESLGLARGAVEGIVECLISLRTLGPALVLPRLYLAFLTQSHWLYLP
jgi:hypothetical protein